MLAMVGALAGPSRPWLSGSTDFAGFGGSRRFDRKAWSGADSVLPIVRLIALATLLTLLFVSILADVLQ